MMVCFLILGGCQKKIKIETDYFSIEILDPWKGLYEYQIINDENYGYI